MRVNEVFMSNQGEGLNVGLPTIFIRFQGCNLNPFCSWCDTKYAQRDGGHEYGIEQLLQEILTLGADISCERFCITGGEPLTQELGVIKLVGELQRVGIRNIEVFSNGTIPTPTWFERVQWCIDVKCPSTGLEHTAQIRQSYLLWFKKLRSTDSVKFVIANAVDAMFCQTIIKLIPKNGPQILISPAISSDIIPQGMPTLIAALEQQRHLQYIWDFCTKNNLRFSLQNHKVLFGNRRGV